MSTRRDQLRGMLAEYNLTYAWLCSQLNKLKIDITPTELSLYVTGRRNGPKANKIINASMDVLTRYVFLYEYKITELAEEINIDVDKANRKA